jgi:hypothetical protein
MRGAGEEVSAEADRGSTRSSVSVAKSASYRYNQKEVLRSKVLSLIHDNAVSSLLDIGAGFADTARPYKDAVTRYHGVEQDRERHSALVAEGLDVTLASFPCPIARTYDLVLASHSIPEEPRLHREFLGQAWNLTAPGGRLVVITFKGVLDESCGIRAEMHGEPPSLFDETSFGELMAETRRISSPRCSRIASLETSDLPSDLAEWFAVRKGKIDEPLLERASAIVARRCAKNGRFELTHQHNVIILHKSA